MSDGFSFFAVVEPIYKSSNEHLVAPAKEQNGLRSSLWLLNLHTDDATNE